MFAFNNSSQVQEREKGLGDEVSLLCFSILQPFDYFNLDISIYVRLSTKKWNIQN